MCDFVAGFDDTEYIWEAVLAHFDVFSVEDCVKFVRVWKGFVH